MKFLKNLTLLLFMIIASFSVVNSQDAHFSQFYASPLTLNPALAATSGSAYRVALNYRDQWRSALDDPLRTFSVQGDLRYQMDEVSKRPDFAGLGFQFYSDQVTTFDLNTNQIAVIGSYHKSLSEKFDHYIGGGIKFGLLQKSINYEDLFFEDQFNAIDAYNLSTGELLPANNFAVLDLEVGINYIIEPDKGKQYMAGVSLAHFTAPNVSFYRVDETPNPDLIRENALFTKITGYLSGSFATGQRTDVQPRLLFLSQGPHTEINLGTNFRYSLSLKEGNKVHFGPWLRMVDNVDGFGLESIVVATGVEVGNFVIGLSYDHNISDLVQDRSGLNAFELSITFLGDIDDYDGWCPKF